MVTGRPRDTAAPPSTVAVGVITTARLVELHCSWRLPHDHLGIPASIGPGGVDVRIDEVNPSAIGLAVGPDAQCLHPAATSALVASTVDKPAATLTPRAGGTHFCRLPGRSP